MTIIEVMAAVILLGVAILGLGMVLADSQRGYNEIYNKAYSQLVQDGHIARRTFDRLVRKASASNITLDDAGAWVQVQYYASAESTELDRYGRFFVDADELKIEHGTVDPAVVLSTQTICSNVSSCVFSRLGKAVQMVLVLDDGSRSLTVVTSATAHNQ